MISQVTSTTSNLRRLRRSCNLRESSICTAEAQLQSKILSSHEAYLRSLGSAIQTGHTAILKQIEADSYLPKNLSFDNKTLTSNNSGRMYSSWAWACAGQRHPRNLSLKLPRWLSNFVWEFEIHKIIKGWNLGLRSINLRQGGSFGFEVVRSGDVKAVKKLIMLGELSASDYESHIDGDDSRDLSLLRVCYMCAR